MIEFSLIVAALCIACGYAIRGVIEMENEYGLWNTVSWSALAFGLFTETTNDCRD